MDKALEAGARALYLIHCDIGGEKQLIPYEHISPESRAVYEIEARAVLDAASAALPATDTSGLVERLRGGVVAMPMVSFVGHTADLPATVALMTEVADRIEALDRENASLRNAHLPEGTVSALLAAKNAGEAADEYRTRAEKAEARLAEARGVISKLTEWLSESRSPYVEDSRADDDWLQERDGRVVCARSYLEGRK